MKYRYLAAGAVTLAALALPAAAAQAFTPVTTTAVTQLTHRPDSGNGGTWATDTIRRTLVITQTGATAYTATVTDRGTFDATAGALTPSQASPGQRIANETAGSIRGSAQYSFTASKTPVAAGVPAAEDGAPSGNQATSQWYKQAFPAGTVFGGTGLTTWSWTYTAQTVTVCVPQAFCFPAPVIEQWTDAWDNGDGNLAADGNITGQWP